MSEAEETLQHSLVALQVQVAHLQTDLAALKAQQGRFCDQVNEAMLLVTEMLRTASSHPAHAVLTALAEVAASHKALLISEEAVYTTHMLTDPYDLRHLPALSEGPPPPQTQEGW